MRLQTSLQVFTDPCNVPEMPEYCMPTADKTLTLFFWIFLQAITLNVGKHGKKRIGKQPEFCSLQNKVPATFFHKIV